MKSIAKKREAAFTMTELLVVVAIFGVVVVLTIAWLDKTSARAQQIRCVNNMKMVGLSSRLSGTDSGDPFIWQTTEHFTKGDVDPAKTLVRYFLNLSNNLASPSLLICPADKRRPASSWAALSTTNVSYFLGLDSAETYPQSILAGDRNVTTNGVRIGPGLVRISTNASLGWDDQLHRRQGNLIMGDGSVQQMSAARFRESARVLSSGVGSNGVTFIVP